MRLTLTLLSSLCLAGASASVASAQDGTPIADVKSAPQRFVNRPVQLVGEAVNVTVARSGLSAGTYRLVDESDQQGILVRVPMAGEVPVPGKIYHVGGTASLNPADARELLLLETSRDIVEPPTSLRWVLAAASTLAIVFGFLLWRTLRQPASATRVPLLAVPSTVERPTGQTGARIAPASNGATTRPRVPTTHVPELRRLPTDVWNETGARLEIVEGPGAGKAVAIGVQEFRIGRDGERQNNLELADTTVSSAHATIRFDEENNRFYLVNESRTNRAVVDGVAVDLCELTDGSRIRLGAVGLVFHRPTAGSPARIG
jgi:Inner membrane component of T3SS, cytoplasmic domain